MKTLGDFRDSGMSLLYPHRVRFPASAISEFSTTPLGRTTAESRSWNFDEGQKAGPGKVPDLLRPDDGRLP
jgi:hypothetical protein